MASSINIGKVKNYAQKNKKRVIVASVVLLVAAFFLLAKKKDGVKTAVVRKGEIVEEMTLSGEVGAVFYAKMAFESSGKILSVGVSEGDSVYKGQFLAKLDTTLLSADYQRALSDLRAAEAVLERVYDDVKGHSADESFTQKETRTTYEVAKDKAYDAVAKAKRSLDGATLTAPFAGIVTHLANPFSGVNVSVTQTQVELIDPKSMYFEVLADQTEVTLISEGESVAITLDSFEDKTFSGKVAMVSFVPKEGETGSIYKVKVDFNGVDLQSMPFKIGMTGDANFVLEKKGDVLYVPQEYVRNDKNGRYVKVDAKGKKVYVETGIESEDSIEITDGLSEGRVIYN